MLRLLRFSALDLARWDACVAASPGAPPYAQAWWLRATAGRWAAVVELGPAGEYRSLLPLPTKWRPWGRVAYQPLFTQQLGLVLTAESAYLQLADYLVVANKFVSYLYQQLPPAVLPLPPLPPGFAAAERLTYHLSLGPAVAALRQAYAADYRRRLRRNTELHDPLIVSESKDLDELIQLFLTYRGSEHTGLRPRHYAPLRRLYAAALARGVAELRQVRDPATSALLAGALFVRHMGGVVYLFAAASPAGRAAGAPLLLVDEALARHAGQPGQVFDFEGGSRPAIGRFFANFGARPVAYPTLTFTVNTWFPTWMRP
ncbi:GNAT family N-acetyltransferase [Hymenobacter sp. H14-R3]|uniref:GNAT family N-acetyltransferase n=1 Tax=Hymenobacter sp. H14-R3 TaxID=3046308 RepID=UPI0024BADC19|nr:GNAT family N-acetyltransferase [Hymenobacter sp. H14-R3]MDJ0365776.1 GNAT family N-acetyltransferase [Hymenobacter sp. H14-R3]